MAPGPSLAPDDGVRDSSLASNLVQNPYSDAVKMLALYWTTQYSLANI